MRLPNRGGHFVNRNPLNKQNPHLRDVRPVAQTLANEHLKAYPPNAPCPLGCRFLSGATNLSHEANPRGAKDHLLMSFFTTDRCL